MGSDSKWKSVSKKVARRRKSVLYIMNRENRSNSKKLKKEKNSVDKTE